MNDALKANNSFLRFMASKLNGNFNTNYFSNEQTANGKTKLQQKNKTNEHRCPFLLDSSLLYVCALFTLLHVLNSVESVMSRID